jgi:mannosyltransferase
MYPYPRKKVVLWILMAATIALYLAIRLYHLDYYSIGYEEAFSVNTASGSWSALWQAVLADSVHPPLFYALLKGWITLGGASLEWMRLLPFLFSALLVLPLLAIARELSLSDGETVLLLLLATFNQPLLMHTQEIRMYSLLALLSVTSLWLFMRFLTQKENYGTIFFWLCLANLAMIYSHYFAFLYLGAEFVLLAVWTFYHRSFASKFKLYLLSLVGLGLAFLPWAVAVTRAARSKGGLSANLDWIARPTVQSVGSFYYSLGGELPVRHAALVCLALLLLPLLLAFRSPQRTVLVALGMLAFLPTLCTVAASYLLPYSVFEPRYLIGCVIPFLLLLVVALDSLRWGRKTLSALLLLWCVLAGVNFVLIPDRKIQWDQMAGRINPAAPVYSAEDYEQLPLSYYGVKSTVFHTSDTIEDPQFVFVYRVGIGPPPGNWKDYRIADSVSESSRSGTVAALHFVKAGAQ